MLLVLYKLVKYLKKIILYIKLWKCVHNRNRTNRNGSNWLQSHYDVENVIGYYAAFMNKNEPVVLAANPNGTF